jgi:hypothetical protein
VVLGKAGPLESRKKWRTKGLYEELHLGLIHDKMTNPEADMMDVMVMDANLLDLNQVLYYYDHRMSLTKRDLFFANLYPASELMAIRLLLLQKIHRNERISLKALVEREDKFREKEGVFSPHDLKAMNLNREEARLIRDIVLREPHFFTYLRCPCLIASLYQTGALQGDDYVIGKLDDAHYKAFPCRHFGGPKKGGAINIAVLPSLTKEFSFGERGELFEPYGFRPTDFFREMTESLKEEILKQTKTTLFTEINRYRADRSKIRGEAWAELWKRIVEKKISFSIQDQRPMVVHPENAERVIQDVCKGADLTIILLGKNVYLSLTIDDTRDVYPHVNRFYVDIMDIKHNQIQEVTEQIGLFIYERLKGSLVNKGW